jgi:hypothetical protein
MSQPVSALFLLIAGYVLRAHVGRNFSENEFVIWIRYFFPKGNIKGGLRLGAGARCDLSARSVLDTVALDATKTMQEYSALALTAVIKEQMMDKNTFVCVSAINTQPLLGKCIYNSNTTLR